MSWPEAFAYVSAIFGFVLFVGFMLGAIRVDIEIKKK